jgi:hypothetical protein
VAVFVLGAGATRGASFVDPRLVPCLPPLDSDFFTQLQRVQNPKHRQLISSVIADMVDLFGVNFRATLETTFTTLEHTLRMIATTKETRDFRRADLQPKRNRLLQAIAAVMEEALTDGPRPGRSGRIHRGCDYHKRLVTDILRPTDEVISFNYDCLVDRSLKRYGDGLWNARYGYGFLLGSRGSNLTGDEYWQPPTPADHDHTVRLYKLHGSLHFDISGHKVKLKSRPVDARRCRRGRGGNRAPQAAAD